MEQEKQKTFKEKLLFTFFIVIVLSAISYGIILVLSNLNDSSYTFDKDGYALYASSSKTLKTQVYSFSSGTQYSYKKLNDNITFNSNDRNAKIDDSTIIHYADNSLLVLKNTVGLDLSTIDNNIIFYYNIYKNTNILYEDGSYNITSFTGEKINFNNLLLRVNDNKYLFLGESIRVTLTQDEIVDFGNYVYFEYESGSIINIYNNTKSYQTISDNITVVSADNIINLSTKEIAKKGKNYITLTNLVIDNNSNIDIITEKNVTKLPTISQTNIDSSIINGTNGNSSGGNVVNNDDNTTTSDDNTTEEVKEDTTPSTPIYKVTNMSLTPIKIDAQIEITDEDTVITSPTAVSIVNNATLKTVYETSCEAGDTIIYVSTASLDPDTEYTLYAKANYDIDGVEYTKSFVSKIFRTEALGVSFKKSYATQSSMSIEVDRENYSDITSLTISLYNLNNERVDYQSVEFGENDIEYVTFDGLDSNTKYLVVMNEISCEGVIVEDGYSIKEYYYTLKKAPSIGNLKYEVNKRESTFNLSANSIVDEDYGIVSYRYEIFDVRQDMSKDNPLLSIETKEALPVSANVDEVKLYRGSAYTYRLIIVFNDNDKIIEYSKELGSTMQLDGVKFPTFRFEETSVTWEQINGSIIVDDPYHTIVGDNYRVVYKNSVDVYTTNKITASTSEETIPIAVNNLRANETYTFQVYTDVNLKDGNDTIDEAYIGSVTVQTKSPNDLMATYVQNTDYSSAFGINFRLTNVSGEDSRLEASTISEMTLTLYEGSNTNGAVAARKKVTDTNEDDYISTIKSIYYDASGLVNPKFFNNANSDFTEKTYTLEISNVKDYTKYKNEINIENNLFTFTANSYIPDIPDDVNKAINVTTIQNKNATLFSINYDNNLDVNTTVGYSLVTNYLNEAKNATRMVYHVWIYNQLTNQYQLLSNLDKYAEFDEDGNVSNVVYTLDSGTSSETFDNDKLRRGNEYYFSYEVYLDIDGDGVEDGKYPSLIDESVILRSITLYPQKQEPKIIMYPSTSTSTSSTWKYKIKDIDNAMVSNNLYSFTGNSSNYSSNPEIVKSNEYNSVTFNGLNSDTFYSIKINELLVKSKSSTYNTLSSQYLFGIKSSLDLTYTTKIEDNRLIVTIDDYNSNSDIIDNIASCDVIISPTNSGSISSRTLSNIKIDNGQISINLIDIPEFINTEFEVGLKAYYDSGNTGFDIESNFKAIQKVSLSNDGNYYHINSQNKIEQNSTIIESEFTTSFDIVNNLINITDKSNKSLELSISVDETGVIYDKNNIVFKELKEQVLSSTSNTEIFDLIIPSISMLNNSNKLNIVSLLSSVEVTAKITKLESIQLQDNLIYIDLYSTDENGTNVLYLKTISKTPQALSDSFVIDELNPRSNYYIQFYTYILNSSTGSYDKYYLYDIDQKKIGETYSFHTLSNVGINITSTEFNTYSYLDKNIRINYTLDNIYGYDHIEYKLYEYVNGNYELVNIDIPNEVAFFETMSITIAAGAGNEYGFAYGKTYKIVITPVGYYESRGETKQIDLGKTEKTFTLTEFTEPYVGISSSKTDNSIYFRVSIDDSSKVVNNGVYTVKLMDSNYNIIKTITDVSANSINKKFEFTADEYNLINNNVYILAVSLEADYTNSGTNFTNITKTKSVRYGNSVSLGAVTASKNADSNYAIDIIFADSYMLTDIDKISYTVSSTSVSYFSTGTSNFNLIYNTNKDLYTFVMPVEENENFSSGNVYTITMNFYTGNNLVDQEEISYYYGGGQ